MLQSLRQILRDADRSPTGVPAVSDRQFKGVINLDIRDSVPDWDAFVARKAPEGAPNVLVVLYDHTGCAAWSPYGGRIEMPTMDRLASAGPTYSQWHATALCSPTRSTFLTGRNHHLNGFASISETSSGFPGYGSHIPPENASIAKVLRKAEWGTCWVGKNHNVPVDEWTAGSSRGTVGAGPGIRSLLRIRRRRDQSVVSGSGRGQSFHRTTVFPGSGLSPLERSCRQGAFVPAGSTPDTSGRNPIPPGTFAPADVVRPWSELSERNDHCSAAWPRCTPDSPNTPIIRSAGSSTVSTDTNGVVFAQGARFGVEKHYEAALSRD